MGLLKSGRKILKEFLLQKEAFNYVYFGILLSILCLINFPNVLTLHESSWGIKFLFLLHTFGQTSLEILALALISIYLKKYLPKALYYLYIGGTFVFVLIQMVESVLVRLMDVSFSEGIQIAFGADVANFIELLRLSDIGMALWVALLGFALICPLAGIGLYFLSALLVKRYPLALKRMHFLQVFCFVPFVLCFADFFSASQVSQEIYREHKKALPWKVTFFRTPTKKIKLENSLTALSNDNLMIQEEKLQGSLPNIYLFVVESLRKDFITEEVAPNLSKFRERHILVDKSFSNANSTHNSWFSIFHSKYPFYWSYNKNAHWKNGSAPLNILKQMGYNVHVYSSAQLKFYGFDQVIFGENQKVADTFKSFPHYGAISASKTDRDAMNAFKEDLASHAPQGNVYIFFLDSTHFNYSWGEEFSAKFQPVEEISWKERLSQDPDNLSSMKNRYKNSIAYVDYLFADFSDTLEKKGLFEESIIVFCGDHGEEFKEEGKLFHASHLNLVQTEIPLYYKFGNKHIYTALSSHIDIFPSIIHYIDPKNSHLASFDGQSIFNSNRKNFALATRYHASFHPYEFFIHNGKYRLLMKFDNKQNIFSSRQLEVIGVYEENLRLDLSKKQIWALFKEPLSSIFAVDESSL